MTFKSIGLDDDLHAYLVAHSGRPDPLLAEPVATTRATLPDVARLQIAPDDRVESVMLPLGDGFTLARRRD